MSWDKEDVGWVIKFIVLTLVWYSSVVCMSFSLVAAFPIAFRYAIITIMVMYLLYSPFVEYGKHKGHHDKISIALYILIYGWVGYITCRLTAIMLSYERTGILPPELIGTAWTNEWWSFFVYMGAWLCPTIYFSVKSKANKEKARIARNIARRQRHHKEVEERRKSIIEQSKFYGRRSLV